MGTLVFHAARACSAQWPPAGRDYYAGAGRSDLSARVRTLQAAVRREAGRRSRRRSLTQPHPPAAGRNRHQRSLSVSSPTVGFAGLTHLGFVSAVAAAAQDFCVIGYEPDRNRVRDITAGRLPILEPALDDLARRFSARLAYTDHVG